MNAIISGRAGVAMLVEGEQLSSYDIDSPERIVARSPNEYFVLFGDSNDLEYLKNVSREEVFDRLHAAVLRERALSSALLLIDGAWSARARAEAGAELETLLGIDGCASYVQGVLYSIPLPAGEAVQSALLLCSGPRTRELLGALVRAQPTIAEVRVAWDLALKERAGDGEEDLAARAAAVKNGLFVSMAKFNRRRSSSLVELYATFGDFSNIAGWEKLLAAWARPGETRHRQVDEMLDYCWGHLKSFRSPRPPTEVSTDLPAALDWPRPGAEGSVPMSAANERSKTFREDVERLNDQIEASGKKISRVRFWRSLPQWVNVAVVLLAWPAWFILQRMVSVAIDAAVFLLGVAAVLGVVFLFQLLDTVLGRSRKSLRKWEAISFDAQARREQRDLEWAAALAPALQSSERASSLREKPLARPTGWLRLTVSNLEGLAERSFVAEVDGVATLHEGTSKLAFELAAGRHVLQLIAVRANGASAHAQVDLVVGSDEILEKTVHLV